MEINLDEKFNNIKLKSKNNIFFIYGQNTFGKTSFLNYFKLLLKKKGNNVFSDLNFDNERNIIEISEEWDLKKELSLSRTSPVRKFILTDLLKEMEINNIDLYKELERNESLDFAKKRINKIIQVEEKEYFVKCDYSFNSTSDLIDSLYKLKITNKDNDEINESLIPKSIKSQLFMKLLIESNSKNKIILFDCPETFFDSGYQKSFSDMIQKLSEDNIIILTYRNPFFTQNSQIQFSNTYFLNNKKEINEFKLSKTILIKTYLLMNKNFKSFEIETLMQYEDKVQEIDFIVNQDDLDKMKYKIFNNYFSILLSNIDFNKNQLNTKKISILTENEQMIFIILSLYNEIKIDSQEIEFKNEFINQLFDSIK